MAHERHADGEKMFNTLIESAPKKDKKAGTALTSVVVHAVLITFAVYATAAAGIEKEKRRQENVKFVEVRKEPEIKKEEPKPEPPKERIAVVPPKGFQVLRAPVEIPIKIPEIDLSKRVTNEEDFTGKGVAGGIGRGVAGGTPVDISQTYFEFQVEQPASAIGGLSPQYPEALRAAGVEGTVRLQFVVDTTGRVDAGTLKVVSSTNELFTQSARSAVLRARFSAARIGARRVKQLVEQPISFQITR
jgi:periplasmic protein TonB